MIYTTIRTLKVLDSYTESALFVHSKCSIRTLKVLDLYAESAPCTLKVPANFWSISLKKAVRFPGPNPSTSSPQIP
jgi:hypothetical protein